MPSVAAPEASVGLIPITLPLSRNVTCPIGIPVGVHTFAVSAESPFETLGETDITVGITSAPAVLTDIVTGGEVLVAKVPFAPKTAVMLCVPTLSDAVLKVVVPFDSKAIVPSTTLPS